MTRSSLDFEYICALVREQSGVILEPHKDYLAELRLDKLAAQTGFESIAAFVEHLKTMPSNHLHVKVVEALLINETSFFRDRYPFETLQTTVLPELMRSRLSSRSINIWSAGCSTGQEPYSIAILLRESFPELATWTIHLIATDFSQQSLDRAEQGMYTNLEVSRGLSPQIRDRYFYQTGHFWQIKDEIRQMVEFQRLNLIQFPNSFPEMDIVFLRNVLIYFNSDIKKIILNKVKNCLKEDGYLFLGSGETTSYLSSQFESIQGKTSLYHRLRTR